MFNRRALLQGLFSIAVVGSLLLPASAQPNNPSKSKPKAPPRAFRTVADAQARLDQNQALFLNQKARTDEMAAAALGYGQNSFNYPMQQGMNPYQQHGFNPYVQQGINPYQQQLFNPFMQQGINPYQQQGFNPFMQQGFNPFMQQGFNPFMQQGINPFMQQGMNTFPQQGFNNPFMQQNLLNPGIFGVNNQQFGGAFVR